MAPPSWCLTFVACPWSVSAVTWSDYLLAQLIRLSPLLFLGMGVVSGKCNILCVLIGAGMLNSNLQGSLTIICYIWPPTLVKAGRYTCTWPLLHATEERRKRHECRQHVPHGHPVMKSEASNNISCSQNNYPRFSFKHCSKIGIGNTNNIKDRADPTNAEIPIHQSCKRWEIIAPKMNVARRE